MTPEFARAIDPLFSYVLDLLHRIECNDSPDADTERIHIRGHFDRAEAMLGTKEDWLLAKYAMVAWIDDMLIDAPWDGRVEWKETPLEFELFNSSKAYSTFYLRAEDAAKMSNKDALEVYYVCVVLGFRGLYRDESGAAEIERSSLPPDVNAWARRVSKSIHLGQGRARITENPNPGTDAAPREGKYHLLGMSLACLCLTSITLILAIYLFAGVR
jgi:type VI secretion system protein ImpK